MPETNCEPPREHQDEPKKYDLATFIAAVEEVLPGFTEGLQTALQSVESGETRLDDFPRFQSIEARPPTAAPSRGYDEIAGAFSFYARYEKPL